MNWKFVFYGCLIFSLISCGSGKTYEKQDVSLEEDLRQKNRNNLPLRDQIRQLPGITFRNGVPALIKNQSDIYGGVQDNFEPLYVLNDYIVGNSFSSIVQLVTPQDVKSIEVLDDAETSFYGSRGANGVIIITTY